MNALELIRRKHAGGELSAAEIGWLARGAVAGDIPDYQLSALLMAINYEHLSFAETVALTRAYVDSGTTLTWPAEMGVFVDKHSTGGVGDKVSLILLPLLASLGFKVAKVSGRALGFTGGTIDKLESIPGFRTNLSRAEMLRVVDEVGCCIVEQSADLVPADKLFYALRDATDTVEELGLIAASVMSKKIACGAQYIVLDVKCGSGAFFKTPESAREFAHLAIRIGEEFRRKVGCVITSMDQPLGRAIGNALEVLEALRFLDPVVWRDRYPPDDLEGLAEVTATLLNVAITLSDTPFGEQRSIRDLIWELQPQKVFKEWIAAQGGDLQAFYNRYSGYFALNNTAIRAIEDGYVNLISGDLIGLQLAGIKARSSETRNEAQPAEIGLELDCRIGSLVSKGDRLATLYAPPGAEADEMAAALTKAFQIGRQSPLPKWPVLAIVTDPV